MKSRRCEIECGHRGSRYFSSLGILLPRQLGLDLESVAGLGAADEIDDGFVADQGSRPPVLRDERKHPMFDLVPLAGTRGKMRDMNLQPGEIGQTLHPHFP